MSKKEAVTARRGGIALKPFIMLTTVPIERWLFISTNIALSRTDKEQTGMFF
jgi:hypothetical protein